MRRTTALLAVLLSLGLTACGATPPQAPPSYADKLEDATSGISTACGETYRLTAFPGDHHALLAKLDATAASSARKLAGVHARNPNWIYLGETVGQIVRDSVSMLGSCGLHRARGELQRAAAGR